VGGAASSDGAASVAVKQERQPAAPLQPVPATEPEPPLDPQSERAADPGPAPAPPAPPADVAVTATFAAAAAAPASASASAAAGENGQAAPVNSLLAELARKLNAKNIKVSEIMKNHGIE